MKRRKSVEACKRKITALQGWPGDPRIIWQGNVIDGRIRMEAWKELQFGYPPPTYEAPTSRHAARALLYARHLTRIARLFPEFELRDVRTASIVLMAPVADVRAVVLAYGVGSPHRSRAMMKKHGALPREKLQAIVGLVRRAQEDGLRAIPRDELERLLSAWL